MCVCVWGGGGGGGNDACKLSHGCYLCVVPELEQ